MIEDSKRTMSIKCFPHESDIFVRVNMQPSKKKLHSTCIELMTRALGWFSENVRKRSKVNC